MTPLPRPTLGIPSAAWKDHGVLFDPRGGNLIELNATGWTVWRACQAGGSTEELIAELSSRHGTSLAEVSQATHQYLDQLRAQGVLDGEAWEAEARPSGPLVSVPAPGLNTYRVLDDRVEVRVEMPPGPVANAIDAAIVRLLGPMSTRDPATAALVVTWAPDDQLRLQGPGIDQRHERADHLLAALPSALNRLAAASSTCLALHAGAVRSPDGAIVVLAGISGAGKSTLTAELVRAGWSYLTDETIGLSIDDLAVQAYPKPLALDSASRLAIGLDALDSAVAPTPVGEVGHVASGPFGAPTAIVMPSYRSPSDTSGNDSPAEAAAALERGDALRVVAEHVLNLGILGQPGLDALVALAQTLPCYRLDHHGGSEAVEAITTIAMRPPIGDGPVVA